MIAIGDEEFVRRMSIMGIREAHVCSSADELRALLKGADVNELIIISKNVSGLAPETKQYKNLVALPDDLADNSDLKALAKSTIGAEIQV